MTCLLGRVTEAGVNRSLEVYLSEITLNDRCLYMRQVYFKAIWLQQKGGMCLVLFFAIKISWRKYIGIEREVQEKIVEQIASCGFTDDLFYFDVCVQSGGCNLIHGDGALQQRVCQATYIWSCVGTPWYLHMEGSLHCQMQLCLI